jgi:hypothetical protein
MSKRARTQTRAQVAAVVPAVDYSDCKNCTAAGKHTGDAYCSESEAGFLRPTIPASVLRLHGTPAANEARRLTAQIGKLNDELDQVVEDLREQGAPWAAVAWLTGLTDSGARNKWGK